MWEGQHYTTDATAVSLLLRIYSDTTFTELLTHLSDFGKDELHAPDLSLATQTVLTTELELLVKTLLLVRTTDRSKGLAVCNQLQELVTVPLTHSLIQLTLNPSLNTHNTHSHTHSVTQHNNTYSWCEMRRGAYLTSLDKILNY